LIVGEIGGKLAPEPLIEGCSVSGYHASGFGPGSGGTPAIIRYRFLTTPQSRARPVQSLSIIFRRAQSRLSFCARPLRSKITNDRLLHSRFGPAGAFGGGGGVGLVLVALSQKASILLARLSFGPGPGSRVHFGPASGGRRVPRVLRSKNMSVTRLH